MCIAILNKKGLLTLDEITNAWASNSDGGGLAWVEDGVIKYFKLSEFGAIYSSDGDYDLIVGDKPETPEVSKSQVEDYYNSLPCAHCRDFDCGSCIYLDDFHNGELNGMSNQSSADIPEEKDLVAYFYEFYTELRSKIDTPILIHFRITTSGFNDEGIHPHFVNDNLILIHNGIFSGLGYKNKSDTIEFAEILASHSNPNDLIFNEDKFFKLIMSEWGASNKVIFLNSKNEWKIYGENLGTWIGDNWYSNNSCETRSYSLYNSRYHYGQYYD